MSIIEKFSIFFYEWGRFSERKPLLVTAIYLVYSLPIIMFFGFSAAIMQPLVVRGGRIWGIMFWEPTIISIWAWLHIANACGTPNHLRAHIRPFINIFGIFMHSIAISIASMIAFYFAFRDEYPNRLLNFASVIFYSWDHISLVFGNVVFLLCIILGPLCVILSWPKYFILAPFSRLLTARRRLGEQPQSASFISADLIAELSINRDGLILGSHRGGILRYVPRFPSWPAGHHLVLAGTRGGKGRYVVVPSLLTHRGPAFVIDPKAELFPITRRLRESLGRKVIVLNPFSTVEPNVATWEPLESVREPSLERDVDSIADGLVRPEHGQGAHFSEWARSLIAAAIEVECRTAPPGERSLLRALDTLGKTDLMDTLTDWAGATDQMGYRVSKTAAAVMGMGEKERGGVTSTASKNLRWLDSAPMRKMFGSSNFLISDILSGKIDIFVVLPEDAMGSNSSFLRLVTSVFLTEAMREGVKLPNGQSILAVLEEMPLLGRMDALLAIAQRAAGSGIEALFVAQDRGAITAVWGPEDASSLVASCSSIRAMNLGAGDLDTADWLARTLGDKTFEQRQWTDTKVLGDYTSSSSARAQLLAPEEILKIGRGKVLLVLRGHGGLIIDGVDYLSHPLFTGLFDTNPRVRR